MSQHTRPKDHRLRTAAILTLLVGLVLATLAWSVVRSPEEKQQVADADRVAEAYGETIDRYVVTGADRVKAQQEKKPADYKALQKVVDDLVTNAPTVTRDGTTAYGRRESDAYRGATERRRVALAPLADLAALMETQSVPWNAFVRSGRRLVEISPKKILEDTVNFRSVALRTEILPAYEKAQKDLEEQVTPEGAELLALDLGNFADDAIKETEEGADALARGEAFFFKTGDRREALYARLLALDRQIDLVLRERVGVLATSQ